MQIWVAWVTRVFMMTMVIVGLGTNAGMSAGSEVLQPRVPPDQLQEAKALQNPFTTTKEFVEKGKVLYEGTAFCSACHGLDGTGKQMNVRTPVVGGPSPTNFGDAAWQAARSDGELIWILKHGSHGTDMAPYLPLFLTEEEAWQIVAYLRSFGKS